MKLYGSKRTTEGRQETREELRASDPISIPFNKIDEVVTALDEMDWTLIAFREDEESKAELQRRMVHWEEMSKGRNGT